MPATPAIERYVRSKQIALARSLARRRKVYLDTRFWIVARNVVQDEGASPAEQEWFDALRQGVLDGTLVCPISDSTFVEVMDQTFSPTRRIATAALIDELSLGVSMVGGEARASTEIARLFYTAGGATDLLDMQELIWTKVSFSLGYRYPVMPDLDPDAQFELQRLLIDTLWEKELSEIVVAIGNTEPPDDNLDASAAQINADIGHHASSLKSYAQTYRDEIVGAADNCCEFAVQWLEAQAERVEQDPPVPGSAARAETARICRNLLIAAFKKPTTAHMLRYMHVMASMHAALRWNKGTQFNANHLFDFEHAAAALSYCDAFFTEAFLANIANAGHTKLTRLNGCRVTSSVSEATEILRGLTA